MRKGWEARTHTIRKMAGELGRKGEWGRGGRGRGRKGEGSGEGEEGWESSYQPLFVGVMQKTETR